MNNNEYVVSGIITFVFLVAKFIEMRFNKSSEEDEPKPLKFLLRDGLLVYVSSLLGFYIISQFEEHTVSTVKEVPAFTGGPDFWRSVMCIIQNPESRIQFNYQFWNS